MNDRKQRQITDDELHAYVDGMMSPERAAEVAAYLEENREAAARVRDYRRINDAIGNAYAPVLEEAVPHSQVDLGGRRRRRFALPMAAAIAGLVLGASAGWIAHGVTTADQVILAELAERTSAAYAVYAPDMRHPVEVSADQSDHLAAWLSNRMAMTFRIPRLTDLGFDLVGGRLMIGESAPAAMLMYEDGQGRRLVLYVRNDLAGARKTELRFAEYDNASVVYWAEGPSGYGISGSFSEQELMPAAHLVRAQLSS